MLRALNVATSALATGLRLGGGLKRSPLGPRPEKPLILYEFEGCPFCRKAREAVTALDLEVLIHPCPKRGPTFRPEVIQRGGKARFPYLVDPNTGAEMYESADIVAYLYKHYGDGPPPRSLTGPLFAISSNLASIVRPVVGTFYRPARHPAQPLTLYGMEGSPYTRLAREALCELELPYLLKTTPVGSDRWRELKERGGKAMVPYLVDPNTGAEMYESADIVDYLRETYGT
jgi:glutathione S-transferase